MAEKQRLTREKAQLIKEKEQLMTDKEQLMTEKEQQMAEKDQLQQELQTANTRADEQIHLLQQQVSCDSLLLIIFIPWIVSQCHVDGKWWEEVRSNNKEAV